MNSLTKILIIFTSSQIGGAEKSLSRLALFSKNKNILLGTLAGEGPLISLMKDIIVYKFGKNKQSIFGLILGCFKVINFCKKNNIKILYISGFRACVLIRIFSIFVRTPKIIHAIRWNPLTKNKTDLFFRLFERFFASQTDLWICNSKSTKKTLTLKCGIPDKKVKVIYNGIILNKENGNVSNVKKENIVITLSNFSPRKGILEYINIIEKIVSKNKNIKFILAGKDNMDGIVQKKIKNKKLTNFIDIPGFIIDPNELLSKSKIMVIPSLLPEGCPTSVLEGMSWSLPIIGYNINGVSELIQNNKTGYLVDPFNQEKMAKIILSLIKNKKKCNTLGKNGLKVANEKFTMDDMLNLHLDLFNSLIK